MTAIPANGGLLKKGVDTILAKCDLHHDRPPTVPFRQTGKFLFRRVSVFAFVVETAEKCSTPS